MAKAWNILGQQCSEYILYEGPALWCLCAFPTNLLKDNASVKNAPQEADVDVLTPSSLFTLPFFWSTQRPSKQQA